MGTKRIHAALAVAGGLLTLGGAWGRYRVAGGIWAAFEVLSKIRSPGPRDLNDFVLEDATRERIAEVALALGLALLATLAVRTARLSRRHLLAPGALLACGALVVAFPSTLIIQALVPEEMRQPWDHHSRDTVVVEIKPRAAVTDEPALTLLVEKRNGRWVAAPRTSHNSYDEIMGPYTEERLSELSSRVDGVLEAERRQLGLAEDAPLGRVRIIVEHYTGVPVEPAGVALIDTVRLACARVGARFEDNAIVDPAEKELAKIKEDLAGWGTLAAFETLVRLAAACALGILAWRSRAKLPVAAGLGALALAEALSTPMLLHSAVDLDIGKGLVITIKDVAPRFHAYEGQLVLSSLLLAGGALTVAIAALVRADAPEPEVTLVTPPPRPRTKRRSLKSPGRRTPSRLRSP